MAKRRAARTEQPYRLCAIRHTMESAADGDKVPFDKMLLGLGLGHSAELTNVPRFPWFPWFLETAFFFLAPLLGTWFGKAFGSKPMPLGWFCFTAEQLLPCRPSSWVTKMRFFSPFDVAFCCQLW